MVLTTHQVTRELAKRADLSEAEVASLAALKYVQFAR